jgi:UDP-glucose 4-epimerase
VAGTALVTGGAGFIGSHLAELLVDDGWEVYALDDLSTGSEGNLFHIYRNPYFHLSVESVLATSVVSELVHKAERPGHTLLSVGVG